MGGRSLFVRLSDTGGTLVARPGAVSLLRRRATVELRAVPVGDVAVGERHEPESEEHDDRDDPEHPGGERQLAGELRFCCEDIDEVHWILRSRNGARAPWS